MILLETALFFFDPNQSGDELEYRVLASPIPNSVTGGFAIDEDNLWYTNWKPLEGGVLVKYNLQARSIDGVFTLPFGVTTPNGLSVGPDGKIWGTDTSTSLFFSFDLTTQQFTKYMTPPPGVSAYGNQTGVVKNPVSRPYWNAFDESGRLWFNCLTVCLPQCCVSLFSVCVSFSVCVTLSVFVSLS